MRCIVAAMVLAAVTLLAPPALASQNDGRLDVLFARLRTTDSAAEATAITREIWAIWQQSESDTVNVLMAKGIDEMSRGNYGAALDVFTQMVEAEPNFAEGWNKRATVYYLIGEFDASVRDIDRTLALEPRHFGALSGLGSSISLSEMSEQRSRPLKRHLGSIPTYLAPERRSRSYAGAFMKDQSDEHGRPSNVLYLRWGRELSHLKVSSQAFSARKCRRFSARGMVALAGLVEGRTKTGVSASLVFCGPKRRHTPLPK